MMACILLASGFGRRFGGNKLLEQIGGKALYRHVLDQLTLLMDEELQVVVVTRYPEILAAAQAAGALSVWNPDAEEGIAASIRRGLAALPDAEWYAFFVADQPGLRAETVRAFLSAGAASGKSLASVHSGGVPGNPTLFHRCWLPQLNALKGDTGGRSILKAHPEEVFWFSVPEDEVQDVDVREQLNQVGTRRIACPLRIPFHANKSNERNDT